MSSDDVEFAYGGAGNIGVDQSGDCDVMAMWPIQEEMRKSLCT